MGACVDNSRILIAATRLVKEGGLGDDISDLPAAGAAPEWMSEKAVAIGQYFVASGVYTVFGATWPTTGCEILTKYLFKGNEKSTAASGLSRDPEKAARLHDRPHRPEAEGAGHRQGQGAGAVGYGHAQGMGNGKRVVRRAIG